MINCYFPEKYMLKWKIKLQKMGEERDILQIWVMKKVSLGGREKENTHLFAPGVLIITRYKALAIE